MEREGGMGGRGWEGRRRERRGGDRKGRGGERCPLSLNPGYAPAKSVPATSTIRPTRVFVLQGSAAAKSEYGST